MMLLKKEINYRNPFARRLFLVTTKTKRNKPKKHLEKQQNRVIKYMMLKPPNRLNNQNNTNFPNRNSLHT